MVLITGGAYQGKVDYALEKFNLSRKDIYTCSRDKVELPEGAGIINNVEELVRACLDNGRDPLKYLAARKSRWNKSVMIVNDISCGRVPMDAEGEISKTSFMWRPFVKSTGKPSRTIM